MNRLLRAVAMLSLPAMLQAQEVQGEAAQRARIASERAQAEAVFRAQEKACYGKFAVTDCLNAAKAQRRQVLADLRRQEISVNEAQRKRKAAEHVRSIEERSTSDKQQKPGQQGADAANEQRPREAAAARKAADRASSKAEAQAKAVARQEQLTRRQAEASAARTKKAEEAARNVKLRQQRLAEAQDRRASMDKRLAERKKPRAEPLPPPPP